MPRRRANGEGTIYQLPDGRWRVSVSVLVCGKLRRKSLIKPRRSECVAALDRLRSEIGMGPVSGDSLTVAEYLNQWLATQRQHLADQSYLSYSHAVEKHISPRLGSTKLAKLVPLHVEHFKMALLTDGVGTRAAQSAFQVLRNALTRAVYPLRLIRSNPCDGIKPPSHLKRETRPFEAAEAKLIIGSAEGTRWHALYAVAFGTGLRPAELFGLTWDDFEDVRGKLRVQRQALTRGGGARLANLKTKSSRRTIDLPPLVVAALKAHRVLQSTNGLWGCNLIFPTISGKIQGYANFYKNEWQPRLKLCQLAHRGFHNCRHTFATLALLAGTPVAVVTKSLGHSNPAITMGTYAHYLPSAENAASQAMQQLLG